MKAVLTGVFVGGLVLATLLSQSSHASPAPQAGNRTFQLPEGFCPSPFITVDPSEPCKVQGKSKLVAFLLSLLIGVLGADWFYLAAGNGCYIFAGIVKLLTGGMLGVWWLVDWIRVLDNSFYDGAGNPLYLDM